MRSSVILSIIFTILSACSSDNNSITQSDTGTSTVTPPASTETVTGETLDRYQFANACYAIKSLSNNNFLSAGTSNYEFNQSDIASASRFFMKPSELGQYILLDEKGAYLSSANDRQYRSQELDYAAEWELQENTSGYRLKSVRDGFYLTATGMNVYANKAVNIDLVAAEGCVEFPEIQTNTEGQVTPINSEDGSVWGMADIHGHIVTDLAFGQTWFYGKTFHPLGVEHALADCQEIHGINGHKSIELFFNASGDEGLDLESMVTKLNSQLIQGELDHNTAGYPEFTDWPSAEGITHTLTYYKWMERAYLGGLRLLTQLAMSWEGVCIAAEVSGVYKPGLGTCNEMVSVDHQIEEVKKLERYIDAQEGGPGKGWFRIARTSQEARDIINSGKLAVVLGIETSEVLDCFDKPREGFAPCDEALVDAKLEQYYDMGVRTFMPVHKSDNGFGPGDGHKSGAEVFQLLQNQEFFNFTSCSGETDSPYDIGVSLFDLDFYTDPFAEFLLSGTLFSQVQFFPAYPAIDESKGEFHCQRESWNPTGEYLINKMAEKGWMIEFSHMPTKSLLRAHQILDNLDYPGRVRTHGLDKTGDITRAGGVNSAPFEELPRCENSFAGSFYESVIKTNQEYGELAAVPLGLDINGTVPAAKPRFGEKSICEEAQDESTKVTYPFKSFDGQITFTKAKSGNKTFDYNTEGMSHYGMIPEVIEDLRMVGLSDEQIEPLFKGAERYLQTWEAAEKRAKALQAAQ